MNEAEVNKKIQQMVHFIRQEAEEKANEIAIVAEEEFNIYKLQLVEAEKTKICAEYDRKERLVVQRKKIEHSTHLNAQRLRYLHAVEDLLRRIRDAAERQLATISNQQGPYAKFLEALIIQGLLRLKEPAALIRCRKEDLHLVETVIESACEIYASKANVALPKVAVDDKLFLPGPPQQGVHGSTWYHIFTNCSGRPSCDDQGRPYCVEQHA
ncbi:V-type proton ATPase subunit E-like isoform X2 [Physcomitrium patens]|uniref:V-type proton ATPase subunit E-like isoform X2 n=1 Tax=Physcomitrium patens TaxID=3218 RepID=UPI003CCCAE57